MDTSALQPDTPIASLTVGQFVDLLNQHGLTAQVTTLPKAAPDKRYIYGLSGLAMLLDCSTPTAHRIKNSGLIPFTQVGRKLIFEEQAVLLALNKAKK